MRMWRVWKKDQTSGNTLIHTHTHIHAGTTHTQRQHEQKDLESECETKKKYNKVSKWGKTGLIEKCTQSIWEAIEGNNVILEWQGVCVCAYVPKCTKWKNGVWYEQRNMKTWLVCTHFDPRLRHFRWPGMNFVALAVRRMDPDDLAGDRFSEASADGSSIQAGVTDSLELHEELLGTELDGGSSLSDFLKTSNVNTRYI